MSTEQQNKNAPAVTPKPSRKSTSALSSHLVMQLRQLDPDFDMGDDDDVTFKPPKAPKQSKAPLHTNKMSSNSRTLHDQEEAEESRLGAIRAQDNHASKAKMKP